MLRSVSGARGGMRLRQGRGFRLGAGRRRQLDRLALLEPQAGALDLFMKSLIDRLVDYGRSRALRRVQEVLLARGRVAGRGHSACFVARGHARAIPRSNHDFLSEMHPQSERKERDHHPQEEEDKHLFAVIDEKSLILFHFLKSSHPLPPLSLERVRNPNGRPGFRAKTAAFRLFSGPGSFISGRP